MSMMKTFGAIVSLALACGKTEGAIVTADANGSCKTQCKTRDAEAHAYILQSLTV